MYLTFSDNSIKKIITLQNSRYIFVIIKPKEIDGLEQLQNNFHKIQLDYNDRLSEDSKLELKDIHLTLPKFKIESNVDLSKYLSKVCLLNQILEYNLRKIYFTIDINSVDI